MVESRPAVTDVTPPAADLDVDLDRNSVKPLFLQIYERFYQKISSGEWRPGDKIPPELDLARWYGVGRVTVRRAIDDLVHDRLLVRRRAKGTFVAEGKLERRLVDVESFTSRMEALGREARARVLGVERLPATHAIADLLHVSRESPVVAVTRLRLANGDPLAIETSTLSLDRFPGLDVIDFEGVSMYRLLADRYGVRPERSHKTLEITSADRSEAAHLGVNLGAPLFLLTATVYQADVPIEHVKTLLRGERFRFRIGY
jgi:GntR family transcriptional regulator